jgi:hypothetical protein
MDEFQGLDERRESVVVVEDVHSLEGFFFFELPPASLGRKPELGCRALHQRNPSMPSPRLPSPRLPRPRWTVTEHNARCSLPVPPKHQTRTPNATFKYLTPYSVPFWNIYYVYLWIPTIARAGITHTYTYTYTRAMPLSRKRRQFL